MSVCLCFNWVRVCGAALLLALLCLPGGRASSARPAAQAYTRTCTHTHARRALRSPPHRPAETRSTPTYKRVLALILTYAYLAGFGLLPHSPAERHCPS